MRKNITLLISIVLFGIVSIAEAIPIEGSSQNLSLSTDLQTENSLFNPDSIIYCILSFDTFSFNQLDFSSYLLDSEPIQYIGDVSQNTAPTPVPEPSSALLLLVGLIVGGFIISSNSKHISLGKLSSGP